MMLVSVDVLGCPVRISTACHSASPTYRGAIQYMSTALGARNFTYRGQLSKQVSMVLTSGLHLHICSCSPTPTLYRGFRHLGPEDPMTHTYPRYMGLGLIAKARTTNYGELLNNFCDHSHVDMIMHVFHKIVRLMLLRAASWKWARKRKTSTQSLIETAAAV